MYEITCPSCSHKIATPFARVGAVTICPKCNEKIAVGVKELRRTVSYPPEDSRNLLLVGAEAEAAAAAAAAKQKSHPDPADPASIEAAIEAGLGLDQFEEEIEDEDYTPDLTDETRESPSVTESDLEESETAESDSPVSEDASAAETDAAEQAAEPSATASDAAPVEDEDAQEPSAEEEAEPSGEPGKKTFSDKLAEKKRAKKQQTPMIIGGVVFAVLLVGVLYGAYVIFIKGEDSRSFSPRQIRGLPGAARAEEDTQPRRQVVTTPIFPSDISRIPRPDMVEETPAEATPAMPVTEPQPVEIRPTDLPPHLQALVNADLPARPADIVRGPEWNAGYVSSSEMEVKESVIEVRNLQWDIETGRLTAEVVATGADPLASSSIRLIELNKAGRGFLQGSVPLPLLLPDKPFKIELELPESRRQDITDVLWEGRPGAVLRNGRSLDDLRLVAFSNGREIEVRISGRNGGATTLDRVVLLIRGVDDNGYTATAWTVDWPFPLPPGQSAEFVTTLPMSSQDGVAKWIVEAAGRSRGRR